MSFKATLVGDDPSSQLSFFDLDVPVRMMNLIMRKMVRGIALPTLFRRRKKKFMRRPWRQTLIVKLLGRTIGYNYLLRRIQAIWRPKASIELIALDNDYFLVKFQFLGVYNFSKFEGPWIILDHYLVVEE